jgi:cell shape-determining protein MreC
VVTAGWHGEGIESRFPPNIPVGEVTKATIFEQEAQERSVVRPYADLRNLNTVQVLTGGAP